MLFSACLMPVAYADAQPDQTRTSAPADSAERLAEVRSTPVPAAAVSSAVPPSAVPLEEAVEQLLPDYSRLSHHELTLIGARWDELGDAERRSLLQEVKLRMARQKGAERTLRIRTQRRYGRIVRRSDGKVLRIETKVIQVAPVRRNPAERSFGVGFERRQAVPEQNPNQNVPAGDLAGGEAVGSAPAQPARDSNR